MARKSVIAIGIVLAAISMGTVGTSVASAERLDADALEAQPHMKAALTELVTAREHLEAATPDKGGHRVKALAHVKNAIAEVKAGIAYDEAHPGAEIGTSPEPLEAQPQMKTALANLQAAKQQLDKASHDKGGHRAKALKETELAIGQVEAGIKFDNTH
jgi:hypothetical protein